MFSSSIAEALTYQGQVSSLHLAENLLGSFFVTRRIYPYYLTSYFITAIHTFAIPPKKTLLTSPSIVIKPPIEYKSIGIRHKLILKEMDHNIFKRSLHNNY